MKKFLVLFLGLWISAAAAFDIRPIVNLNYHELVNQQKIQLNETGFRLNAEQDQRKVFGICLEVKETVEVFFVGDNLEYNRFYLTTHITYDSQCRKTRALHLDVR